MKRSTKTARAKNSAERLSRALRERDDARAFQASMEEILAALSRSTSDAKPVFEAIVRSVLRLFDTRYAAVFLVKGDELHLAAADAERQERSAPLLRQFRASFPQPINYRGFTGKALRSGKVSQIGPIIGNPKATPQAMRLAKEFGYNTMLVAPLMREGKAIGAIGTTRPGVKLFSARELALFKAFAAQAVIAIENARRFNETKEALERQTATAEILKVISSSPTDVRPALDLIAERATLLCHAKAGFVTRFDGKLLHLAAFHGVASAAVDTIRAMYPVDPATGGSVAARVVHSRAPVQVPDVLADATYAHKAAAKAADYRSVLGVPLIRDGQIGGVIVVVRGEAGYFPQRQLELLQTFADQAVIAIENARLFNETKEALEQQTATAEILKVIASSPTDVQPVFDVIVERAVRLCGARFGRVYRYDDSTIHMVAGSGLSANGLATVQRVFPRPAAEDTVVGQVILSRAPRFIRDIGRDPSVPELSRQMINALNTRSQVTMPMLRAGEPIGAITMGWDEPEAYDERKVALLRTFADQAAIAVENARLFNETKEALEQQTASSDILRVISSSPTDLAPVFDAILASAMQLCEAHLGTFNLYDGESLRTVAQRGGSPQFAKWLLERGPIKPAGGATYQAITERRAAQIADAREAAGYREGTSNIRKFVDLGGVRTFLAVPLLRERTVIGNIGIYRPEVRPFTAKQIALVSSFANQAVIAIENVRLFNETKEALERQTATAEILRVISGTPTDTQPVFDAIVRSAERLLSGRSAALILRRESEFFVAAHSLFRPEAIPEKIRTVPLDRQKNFPSRVILDGDVVHIPDWDGDGVPEHERAVARTFGWGSGVQVPLLRESQSIGALTVSREVKGHFHEKEIALLRSFADQAVIAMENVRLFNETKEALERQTAISDILRVISGSPADVKPVLDTVAAHAARICHARTVDIVLPDGASLRVVASVGDEVGGVVGTELPLDRSSVSGRSIMDRAPVHVADMQQAGDEFALGREFACKYGYRTILGVPLLREGRALGAIMVRRAEVRPVEDKYVALLKTFADQAAIAIENARLFTETKEALERQTATAEILKVIAGSPSDVQPVFDAIAASARQLIGGLSAVVARVIGDEAHLAAFTTTSESGDELLRTLFPVPISDSRPIGRTILTRLPVLVSDTESSETHAGVRELARARGFRSMVGVPMIRDGVAIGAINVTRRDPGPFTDHQVNLLKTFADQAVIAIENVRLFNETKEALEQQTATAEILRVISGTPTDTQPVFDAIARSALRIFGGMDVGVGLVEGDAIEIRAGTLSYLGRGTRRLPLNRDTYAGRAVLDGTEFNVPDVEAPDTPPLTRERARLGGWRAVALVPMLRDGVPIGHISVYRSEPVALDDKQFALLRTFAAQAVIAIENVRLFNETKEALERQTATAEILKVMSASPSDVQPVFDAVAVNAARVCGVDDVAILRTEGRDLRRVAHYGSVPVTPDSLVPVPPGSVNERVLSEHRTLHIPDTAAPSFTREFPGSQFPGMGVRSLLATPLVHDGAAVGVIHLRRAEPRPFTDKQIAMLETFADQAVIAIENVRLFKELQERTEALTKSVSQLTALGEVSQAISSTLQLDEVLRTIVQRAVQLSGMDRGSIYEFEARGERFHLRAAENIAEEIIDMYRKSPIRLGEGAVGRAGATREPVVVEDVLADSYRSRARELVIKSGSRAVLAVPLLREDLLLGALVVSRKSPGPFAPEVVNLLKTFATQSAVAIENARLFRELAEKSRELEEASRHKSQFLASMSHELRTPLNAILGFNEMILGQVYGEVPADMKEPLDDIQKSGKHLLRLINNVLDLAKIEAGKMELALGDYSVQDTVESVRSTLRPLAEAKGLEFVVSVPEDIPLAYGDGGRLTQCLMNLAGNSLKFTKEGRVEIAVEAENGHLRWRVSDTGIGIPPDKIETLFSEFKQTDATIASEYGGTGLGLSITKKFVEMHGGRIWVESEPGKGSVFTVEIPLRVTAPA